ncbi:porin family protein [Vibrio kasasachensis]|uniref:porin family protein n=1 Tax=Vibrio kasasachensis TaxID=2910248 RepID=UPI003D138FCC
MKRNILLFTAIAVVSVPVVASESNSFRLGGGYSQTDMDNSFQSSDYGSGFKLEFGYDVNPYIGIKLSYEQNEGDMSFTDGSNYVKADFDGSTFKGGFDLGYPLESAIGVFKPYVAIGLSSYSEDATLTGDITGNTSASSSQLYYGVGARFTSSANVYLDLSYDLFEVEDSLSTYDFTQLGLTIGYQF